VQVMGTGICGKVMEPAELSMWGGWRLNLVWGGLGHGYKKIFVQVTE